MYLFQKHSTLSNMADLRKSLFIDRRDQKACNLEEAENVAKNAWAKVAFAHEKTNSARKLAKETMSDYQIKRNEVVSLFFSRKVCNSVADPKGDGAGWASVWRIQRGGGDLIWYIWWSTFDLLNECYF